MRAFWVVMALVCAALLGGTIISAVGHLLAVVIVPLLIAGTGYGAFQLGRASKRKELGR